MFMTHKEDTTVRSTHGVVTFLAGIATWVRDHNPLIRDCKAHGCIEATEEEISVAKLGELPPPPDAPVGAEPGTVPAPTEPAAPAEGQ